MGDEPIQPIYPVLPEAQLSAEAEQIEPTLEQQLLDAQAKATEHYDAFLRARAEQDNAAKRAIADVSNARKFAVESFANELLGVKDSLEAALAQQAPTFETLKAGVELTLKQLNAAFERAKVAELNPLGEKFDPHKHQAIAMVEAEATPNTVVSVLQKGYQLNDRVLRPAMVTVAKT
ncbi:MAG: nucleotide exchange factor GrpE [Burkholderiales bacterium]